MTQISRQSDGGYTVSGELVFDTVPELVEKGRAIFESDGGAVVINLDQVTRADSAGLALLIEWRRMALGLQKTIAFQNVPPQMIAIAKVSGLDTLLGLEPRGS